MDIFEAIQKSAFARLGDDVDAGHIRTVGYVDSDPSYLDADEKYLLLDLEMDSEEAVTIETLDAAVQVKPHAFRLPDGLVLSFYALTPVANG